MTQAFFVYLFGMFVRKKRNRSGCVSDAVVDKSKGNLEMRPIFHFTERRIEAHVCICFVAYKIYKELERILRLTGIGLSVDKVIDIAKTIITIDIKTDGMTGTERRTLSLTEEQQAIKPLFDLKKLLSQFG